MIEAIFHNKSPCEILNMYFSAKNEKIIQCVSLLGLGLSCYAVYVEYQTQIASAQPYSAFCDISETISCSKVFSSEYGKIYSKIGLIDNDSVLNVPNAVYGAIFYTLMTLLSRLLLVSQSEPLYDFLLLISTISVILSAYLGYILFAVLENTCILCFSTHACNVWVFCCLFAVSPTAQNDKLDSFDDSNDKNMGRAANMSKSNKKRR